MKDYKAQQKYWYNIRNIHCIPINSQIYMHIFFLPTSTVDICWSSSNRSGSCPNPTVKNLECLGLLRRLPRKKMLFFVQRFLLLNIAEKINSSKLPRLSDWSNLFNWRFCRFRSETCRRIYYILCGFRRKGCRQVWRGKIVMTNFIWKTLRTV